MLVGLDEALFDLDVELLQAEAVGDALTPHRDQQALTVDALGLVAGLDGDRHLAVRRLEAVRLHLRAGHHLDATLPKDLGQLLADVSVFRGQQRRQELDQGHLGAVAVVDAGELGSHGAGTDDDDRCRHLVEVDGVVAVDDPIAVHLQSR